MVKYRSIERKSRSNTRGQIEDRIDIGVLEDRIKNAILTPKGSRINRREFGCRIKEYLFDLIDEQSKTAMRMEIRRTLNRDVPEIETRRVSIRQPEDTRYAIVIEVVWFSPVLHGNNDTETTEVEVNSNG